VLPACLPVGVIGVDDFDPEAAARAVTEALLPLGVPDRDVQEKRYLKSDLEFLGVAVPDMRRVVKAAGERRITDLAAELCGSQGRHLLLHDQSQRLGPDHRPPPGPGRLLPPRPPRTRSPAGSCRAALWQHRTPGPTTPLP
jgi:hypothetical protein